MDRTHTTDQSGLTTEQAAAIIGANKRTLDNWRSLGRGPAYVKLSKRLVRYLLSDVQAYIEQNRVEPANN